MSRRRALFPIHCILILAFAPPAVGQGRSLDLFQYTLPLHMARALPVVGPEAAPANPARLAEAGRGYFQIGTASAGYVSMSHAGAGAAIPGGVSLGLAGLGVAGRAPGTHAVFLERRAALQAAYRMPGMAPGAAVFLGYALALHHVDAWSIYGKTGYTHDLGLVWRPAPLGRGWRADLGLALRDLVPMDARIPDSAGAARRYRLYGPKADIGAHLASPSGLYSGWITVLAGPRFDLEEYFGPFHSTGSGTGGRDFEIHIHRYGVSFRPAGVIALRMEQIGFSVWQAGATLGAGPLLRWRLEMDAAVSKGGFQAYFRPSGSGYTFAWTLRSGW